MFMPVSRQRRRDRKEDPKQYPNGFQISDLVTGHNFNVFLGAADSRPIVLFVNEENEPVHGFSALALMNAIISMMEDGYAIAERNKKK